MYVVYILRDVVAAEADDMYLIRLRDRVECRQRLADRAAERDRDEGPSAAVLVGLRKGFVATFYEYVRRSGYQEPSPPS